LALSDSFPRHRAPDRSHDDRGDFPVIEATVAQHINFATNGIHKGRQIQRNDGRTRPFLEK
jgi:hypothetical protein